MGKTEFQTYWNHKVSLQEPSGDTHQLLESSGKRSGLEINTSQTQGKSGESSRD